MCAWSLRVADVAGADMAEHGLAAHPTVVVTMGFSWGVAAQVLT